MKREALMVAAIENGTVIDHIPSSKLFQVVRLLHLEDVRNSSVMVGYNLQSKKMGRKSIIKDYEVVEKKCVTLPHDIVGIVKCANPKCITNNEPMATHFTLSERQQGVIQCKYCQKEQSLDHVKIC